MINLIASICKYVSAKKDYISKYYTITSQNVIMCYMQVMLFDLGANGLECEYNCSMYVFHKLHFLSFTSNCSKYKLDYTIK